jgi:mono/diheme cytochrome c family protein
LQVFGLAILAAMTIPFCFAAAGDETLDERLQRQFTEVIRPLLKTHCGDCHMGGANEAGVNLEDYSTIERIREHESSWEQVRGVIRANAMPPPEDSELSKDDRSRLVDWIESALHEIDCDCEIPTPPVTLRRLNRVEYDNTVRDLLGIDFKPSEDIGFLSDDVGNGFDNQGEVLSLSPIMLEKYMQAASLIASRVIEIDRGKMRNQAFDGIATAYGETQKIEPFLAAGTYDVTVRMRFGDRQPDKAYVVIRWNGETIRELDVNTDTKPYEFQLDAKYGHNQLEIEYFTDENPDRRADTNRRLFVDNVRFKGPSDGQPAFTYLHERLVIAYPEQVDATSETAIGTSEASRRVFAAFLPKAYRRPVSNEEIEAVVDVCNRASQAGFSYLESLRFGLQATLVSPQFLYRAEAKLADGSIDDHALASRLSYFLWSTMPDDELLALADQGTLRNTEVLQAQVTRMLDDPKSVALVDGFFAQWLGLRNLNKIDIDQNKFVGWNDRLRASMIKETQLFCSELLAKGSIDDLLTANFTYVNPRLAEFYGVLFDGRDPAELYTRNRRANDGLRRTRRFEREDEWIRVELPENRRGILTQAAVLALTSNPTRASPVKRGKWVLENLLGDPPPSAPPNVPSLEEAVADEKATMRESLELHRSNPSCAGCHKIMDPIGLGLENFDAIGRWRDKEDGIPIDAQGELVDGSVFRTPTELVAILSTKSDQVLENLAARMLIYATGRGIQRPDRCVLRGIIAYTKERSRSVRALVEAICLSDAFLQRPTITPIAVSPPALSNPSPSDEIPTNE